MSRLTKFRDATEEDSKMRVLRRESNEQSASLSCSSVLFPKVCLFCKKESKWKDRKKEVLVKCVTTTAALSILETAKEKNDEELLLEIQGQDLIAKEAQYHTSCRKEYTRKLERNVLKSETVGAEEQRAHTLALEQLCKFIDQKIMTELNVEMISTLRERYLSFLQETDFYNPEYRTRRLREKLLRHYGERLAFHFEQQQKDEIHGSQSRAFSREHSTQPLPRRQGSDRNKLHGARSLFKFLLLKI